MIEKNIQDKIQQLELDTIRAVTELQKDVINKEDALRNLASLREDFKTNYFTYPGQIGLSASKIAEKTQGIPGVDLAANNIAEGLTGMDAKGREQYIQNATKYVNSIEQFFNTYRKEITGAGAGLDEIKLLKKSYLNGDMAPSEFLGALDQIMNKSIGESEFKKNILNKGIDVTSNQGLINYLKEKGYSDAQIYQAIGGK